VRYFGFRVTCENKKHICNFAQHLFIDKGFVEFEYVLRQFVTLAPAFLSPDQFCDLIKIKKELKAKRKGIIEKRKKTLDTQDLDNLKSWQYLADKIKVFI